ncbi:MAG: hypothetical protein ILP10_08760, partial [Lachnospiraceae bacterium]|nr:hypothetical protein [Lachnospiraceae bacterium]
VNSYLDDYGNTVITDSATGWFNENDNGSGTVMELQAPHNYFNIEYSINNDYYSDGTNVYTMHLEANGEEYLLYEAGWADKHGD